MTGRECVNLVIGPYNQTMGICPKFTSLLIESLLKGGTKFPLRIPDALEVLSNTTTMLVDLTQLLYISNNQKCLTEIMVYENIQDFIKSSDPIGEIVITGGRVENRLHLFREEDASDLVVQRIISLESKWRRACRSSGTMCKLKSIFLIIDGDSPAAKNETRKKRHASSQVSCTMRKLEAIAKAQGIDITADEVNLKGRFYECEKREDNYMLASMPRFLVQKDKRDKIISQLTKKLTQLHFNTTDMYIVHGQEDGVPCKGITQVWGSSPRSDLPTNIPYYEADSIIPYLWSHIDNGNDTACIVTSDSDMLVTIVALACPRIYLLNQAKVSYTSSVNIFDGKVAVVVKPDTTVDNKKHLDLLLHMTMGGSDYVENVPWCGATTLLKGAQAIMSRETTEDYFPNVRFVFWKDVGYTPPHEDMWDAVIRIDHKMAIEGNVLWDNMLRIVYENESIFPVRLGMCMYLVSITNCSVEATFDMYNKWSRGQSFKCVTDYFEQCYHYSMRRRLFFLSLVSETRMGLETKMLSRQDIAEKCGISFGDFMYIKKMFK